MSRSISQLWARFEEPGPEFGPLPIWWWSGAPVTRERLRWQMSQLVSHGIRQAVVMCLAPTGPLAGSLADDPPFLSEEWLDLLDSACADAYDLGFMLWMYDQVGFSGANFQGQLIASNPSYAGHALVRDSSEIRVVERGFDYFSPTACAALLDSVHGTLERHVGQWFGKSIGGFFQDELPAMPTWGPDFAETFESTYGYSLAPLLPSLFSGTSASDATVRRDYHAHRARLARRGFFDQHDAWYASHGLICGFDQASPAREGDPVGGVHLYGDYLGTHSGYGAPGSDHWGDAKVHSSLAHAHGRPRTWIEAFHSSGWGGTLEETYDWLAPFLRRGATLYDPHAVYYSTVGGWWEWAPPSTCWRQPYWPSYDVFSRAVARLCSVLSAGEHVCDTVLLSPTSTAQAYLTLDGALPEATRADAVYRELNGVATWFAERPGALEAAGVDHDVLSEAVVASGAVSGDGLRVGTETYRNVVVPAAPLLSSEATSRLLEFADAGGRVVCVGAVPPSLSSAVRSGLVLSVGSAAEAVPHLRSGPVRVSADAPFLLRRVGDVYVLLLTAHDAVTGTAAPILSMEDSDWWSDGFSFQAYWEELRASGYTYRPTGSRSARVRITGLPGATAQRWDPRTGHRTALSIVSDEADGDAERLDVPFSDGPISLVVLGSTLPAPTRSDPGPEVATVPVAGPWTAEAVSTLDNRWGDLAAASRDGILPIEVWRMEHRADGFSPSSWSPATATYGPFAEVRDADSSQWRPVEWSLSRGIRDDPVHVDTLGPKGYVPEEFLDWRWVARGSTVSVRTSLAVPPSASSLWLAVGANADRAVSIDGQPAPVSGSSYQTFSPLPSGRTVRVSIEFTAEQDGPLRASFAVVSDRAAYARPEWIVAADPPGPGLATDLGREVSLASLPEDARIQVASDGPCIVLVNGTEVGRQGDFGPYPAFRELRVHAYDVGRWLHVGRNVLTLRVIGDTAVALDSPGLGVLSDEHWSGPVRSRRRAGNDPLPICLEPRAHPLPHTGWLSPASRDGVVAVVPDLEPAGPRTERLRFPAPLGTTTLRVPTSLPFTAEIGDVPYQPVEGRIDLPEPLDAGTPITLVLQAIDGRRGGALLDGPIEVGTAPAETELRSWEELGLRNLGGEVRYRTTVSVPEDPAPDRVELDLGSVRGTADVVVNGSLVDRLVWSPWRCDVTSALVPGENTLEVVVRGTLAGYLSDASPTRAVAAGQVRTGLFGPVRLLYKEIQ